MSCKGNKEQALLKEIRMMKKAIPVVKRRLNTSVKKKDLKSIDHYKGVLEALETLLDSSEKKLKKD